MSANRNEKSLRSFKDEDHVEAEGRESSDIYEINMKTPSGKMFALKVKSSDTIGSLKLMIEATEHISFEQQEVFFNEKILENINTLANLHITKGSTLKVLQKSVELMEIFVNTFDGNTISLSVKPMDTIAEVKSMIESKGNIPRDEQALIFNNEVLGDHGTLFDFDINTKSILTLMLISSGFMTIFIKTHAGSTVTLNNVQRSDTISKLKVRIYNVEGIRPCEQRLSWRGKPLLDEATLADYQISKDSTIDLALRKQLC